MSLDEARRLDGYGGANGAFLASLVAQGWIDVDRVADAVTLTSAGHDALASSNGAGRSA
ncbi:hypothetical protein [Methylobacterium variabile]|jgi:hypothetical protein|uniref:hypothetical protein n=1 Tax=Methylobacterium variabile TaxID=298794 RepID=UPI000A6D3EEA|nr:hypothetical protein [Methylobacterium variabile]